MKRKRSGSRRRSPSTTTAQARLQAGMKKQEDFAAVQADLQQVFTQDPDYLPARYMPPVRVEEV